jgi:type I restriction enzyme, S subunit
MNDWQQYKLGQLVDTISETYKFKGSDEEVIFLNTSDIGFGKILNHSKAYAKNLPGQAKKKIKNGDLLFSEIRPANHRYALVKDISDNYVVSTKLMVLRSNGKIDSSFLMYFLTQHNTLDYLQVIAESRSGTFPQITFAQLSDLDLYIPPLPEQRAIAAVLSSLEDKIDLLNRQNKTLENLAETLFNQWFVEEVNESWKIYKFVDLVNHVKPGTNFQPKRVEHGIPFLNVRNLNNGFLDFSDISYISEEEFKRVHRNWMPEENDILISRIGTLGIVAVISKEDLPVAVHYNMINLKAKLTSFQFLYFLLKSSLFQEKYRSIIRQSVQEYVAIEDVENIEITLPINSDKFRTQENIFIEIFTKLYFNRNQIRTISTMRDSLLPKLISGEVRVKL